MRLKQVIPARLALRTAAAVALCLFASDRHVFAFEQQQPPVVAPVVQSPVPAQAPPSGPEIQLTADEAVRMALENNLGVRSDRLSPQISTLNVAQARSAFMPTLSSTTSTRSSTRPPNDFLASGGVSTTTTSESLFSSLGVSQNLRWGGGRYSLGVDASKETVNTPSSFNPELGSNLNFSLTQPLLRNFRIDGARQQLFVAQKNEEIADLQLRQQLTATERVVRNAYYDLVGAIGQLDVARESLELSQTSLRQNQRRVEVGAMAQIDILEAQAEVAQREEAVIITEAEIKRFEDRLRTLILNPQQPDFWSLRLVPIDRPSLTPTAVDVEAAISNALANRTDLAQARKRLEASQITLDYARNQRLPDANLVASYNTVGFAGTQIDLEGFPPVEVGRSERAFREAINDVFGNDYKTWSLALQINYPIGRSQAEAQVASTRIQREQEQNTLRELEIGIAAQVRDAGRRVSTSLQRVQSTERARQFAERRLEAEEKRQTVGLGTTFQLLQAQRDLSSVRQQEQRAIIDYNRAIVDFQAVQLAPFGGG